MSDIATDVLSKQPEDFIKRQDGPEPAEMLASSAAGFKLKIISDSEPGWVGQDNLGWGITVQDEASATTFVPYTYQGITYLKSGSQYLSHSNNRGAIGFYGWWGALGWSFDGDLLKSQDNYYLNQGANFFGVKGLMRFLR